MEGGYFIGVDGGSTKTRFVCIDALKNVVGESLGKSTNWNSVGKENSKKEINKGIEEVVKNAKISISDIKGICLGMSGVDRPADIADVKSWISEFLPTVSESNVTVCSDAVIALGSGTDGNLIGVVIISGTGMIAYGINAEGVHKRAGGWGPLLGDEGSGYAIGLDSLQAAVKAHDQRGPETKILDAMLKHLNLTKAEELIPWAYQDNSWDRFASLSKIAFTCAKEGDSIAEQIVEKAANALCETVLAVCKQHNWNPDSDSITLVLAGGNLVHENSELGKRVEQKFKDKFVKSSAKRATDSAMGAALITLIKYK